MAESRHRLTVNMQAVEYPAEVSEVMSTEKASPWERIPERRRKWIIWGLWFITWVGLVGGVFYRVLFEYVVLFSAGHVLLFLILFRFAVDPFPVQVRVAYFIWVAVGTYAPYMTFLMYITLVGLATNLFLGYCPLARMMYLMPWNRDHKLSIELIGRVILSRPVSGKFQLLT
jgi:hypothetical protein